jgi:UDP-N-acetyl-2-amino-2-deoxyglucuronate dehydrogenase
MATHIGLIGGGNISATHALAVRAIGGAEVTAIFGTNADNLGRLSREHKAKSYIELESFLDHRPMDMVIIGSPSGLHASHGIAAAKRGLHVLTEKPIDISTERAERLIQAAEERRVKHGVIFQDRVKPEIKQLKQWVSSGALGNPILVDARVKWYRPPEYYGNSRWRGTLALDGGGALINQGIHTVDLLLWLLGKVVNVQARTTTALHNIEAEDTAVAILEFASGALGTLEATTAAYPGYARRVEITGSEGTLILDNDRVVTHDLRTPPAALNAVDVADQNPSASSPVVSDTRWHQAVIEDFIRAIEQDSEPICDGHEGLRSLALVEAIYRSAKKSGGSVNV